MGNKLGRKRQVVDEKYTRPQGLYQHKDVDQKKLKKLILDSKLAPCYPGDDDCACDLEECPICFLYYPSLNRSRCCMKGICTECFLQMKTPNSTRPTQCPFCKTSNYAVEYRGVKTKEEKGLEQIEEQRVIEAKIRMRQKELQDDEERMLKRTETSASTSMRRASEVDYRSITAPSIASTVESEEIVATHVPNAASALRLPPRQRQNREEDFDLDLEDIMVMEAIWLSIQENDRAHDPPYNDAAASAQSEEHIAAATTQVVAGPSMSSSSPSSGFACAIAALAESQQIMTGSNETTNNYHGEISAYNNNNMPSSSSSRYSNRDEPETFFPQESSAMMVTSSSLPDDGQQFVMNGGGQWVIDHRSSEAAEAGNTYSYGEGSTDDFDNNGLRSAGEQDVTSQSDFQPAALGGPTIVPESFEEQMMLAMAVSLAEARVARRNTSPPGLAWH